MTYTFGLDTFGDRNSDADGKPLPQAQTIRNVIEEGVFAEQAGVDFFGIGEHHTEYFPMPAGDVVLAAIAARTERIRLGSASSHAAGIPVTIFVPESDNLPRSEQGVGVRQDLRVTKIIFKMELLRWPLPGCALRTRWAAPERGSPCMWSAGQPVSRLVAERVTRLGPLPAGTRRPLHNCRAPSPGAGGAARLPSQNS